MRSRARLANESVLVRRLHDDGLLVPVTLLVAHAVRPYGHGARGRSLGWASH